MRRLLSILLGLALLAFAPPALAAASFTGGSGYNYPVAAADNQYRAISFQVKTTQAAASVGLAGHHNATASGSGWTLILNSNGTLTFQAKVGTSQAFVYTSSTAINDGNWHSVVMNFTFGLGLNALYIDGALEASDANSGGTIWGGTTQGFRIGRTVDTFWTAFTGSICDLRFYPVQMTTDQVKSLGKKFNPGRVHRSFAYETALIRDTFEPHAALPSAVGTPTFVDHCPRIG
jgi:hypothetical protein